MTPSGSLDAGSVTYLVESVHSISPRLAVVIVDQTYTDRDGNPRDERARHTHTYVISFLERNTRILAGQNTVRTAD